MLSSSLHVFHHATDVEHMPRRRGERVVDFGLQVSLFVPQSRELCRNSTTTMTHLPCHASTERDLPASLELCIAQTLDLRLGARSRVQHEHHRRCELVLCRTAALGAFEDVERVPGAAGQGLAFCGRLRSEDCESVHGHDQLLR